MKTMEEIYRELLSSFGTYTGLEPREGTDLSARMYALAAQIYSLYIQADWVARQAFPQTAEGEYLDLHAQLRGLEHDGGGCGGPGTKDCGPQLGHRPIHRGLLSPQLEHTKIVFSLLSFKTQTAFALSIRTRPQGIRRCRSSPAPAPCGSRSGCRECTPFQCLH